MTLRPVGHGRHRSRFWPTCPLRPRTRRYHRVYHEVSIRCLVLWGLVGGHAVTAMQRSSQPHRARRKRRPGPLSRAYRL